MKLRIALVRHGLTDGNFNHRMSGHTDHQLIPEGIDQLYKVKQNYEFPKYDRLYSSDLSRTYETAKILFDEEVRPENRRYGLREIFFGDIENVDYRELRQPFHREFFTDSPLKIRAENAEIFQKRVFDELHNICQEMVEDDLKTVMIVAHAGTIRMIHFTLLNLKKENYRDLSIDNGTGFLFEIDYHPETREMKLLDYHSIGG